MKIIDTVDLERQMAEGELNASQIYWLYNGLDCCITNEIRDKLLDQLTPVTKSTYARALEMQGPFLEMMLRGVRLDETHRKQKIVEVKSSLNKLEYSFNRLCSEGLGLTYVLNWRSHTQVKALFYEVLGYKPVTARNAHGFYAPTANREALEKLSINYVAEPFCNFILAMRDLGKQLGFLETKLDADKRIRCNFNIAGTNTGRLSSSFSDFGTGSNLQNVDRNLKYTFVPDPGKAFINIDLEQADSRNVGALAWNMFLESHGPEFAGSYLDACESGDLHTTVCRMAWKDLDWGDDPALWRSVADRNAYRTYSYRDMAKKLGHGCLTADHEVLTPNGWVPIADQPTTIMEWDETGSRFASTTNWVAQSYTGELQSFEGNSMSALMTHDHRVPYKADQRSLGIRVRPASAGPQCAMPLGSGWEGGNEVVPAKLIAAFMCDGHQEKNWMAFHFHKQRKRDRLIELCEEYNYEYRIHGDKVRVRGHLPKRPSAAMFSWSKFCLTAFVAELRYWDGHVGKTAISIHCKHREDLEWYQTFGRICGVGGNIQKPRMSGFGTIMYSLQQNNRQYANGSSSRHERIPTDNVMVYCPTVASGWFYVRRNGKIFITGNSNYLGQPKTMAMHSKVPAEQIEEFQRNYFGAFPCITAWQEETIRLLKTEGKVTNLFGRQRCFFGRHTDQPVINAAIAYSPQGTTGDQINEGILRLWQDPRFELLVQVHDSILLQVDENLLNELTPIAVQLMKAERTLAGGREFHVPLEAKTGWNWGDFDKRRPDKNPYGLIDFNNHESRTAPKYIQRKKLSLKEIM